MTLEKALSFLRAHQPLPATDDVDEGTLRTFVEVQDFFGTHPVEAALPLLFGALSGGDGHGSFQELAFVLAKYAPEQVARALGVGLRHSRRPVRLWSAIFAGTFPSDALVPELGLVIREQDAELQVWAVLALKAIGTANARDALRAAQHCVGDGEVRREILDALNELDSRSVE